MNSLVTHKAHSINWWSLSLRRCGSNNELFSFDFAFKVHGFDTATGVAANATSHNLMTFSCHLHVSTFNSSVLLFYCVDVKPIFIVQSIWTRDTDAYKGIINKITIFVLFLFHDRECPSSALECTFCSIIDGNNSSNDDDDEDSISRNSNWIHSQRCNNHNAFVGQSPVEARQKRRNNCRISSFRWMNCSRTGFCLVAVHEKWNTRRTKENQMENSKFYRSVSVQLAFVLIAMSPLLRSLNERLVIRDQGAHKRSIKSDRTKRNRRTAADVINYNFIIAIMATATMKTTMAEAGDAEVLHLRIEKKREKKNTWKMNPYRTDRHEWINEMQTNSTSEKKNWVKLWLAYATLAGCSCCKSSVKVKKKLQAKIECLCICVRTKCGQIWQLTFNRTALSLAIPIMPVNWRVENCKIAIATHYDVQNIQLAVGGDVINRSSVGFASTWTSLVRRSMVPITFRRSH